MWFFEEFEIALKIKREEWGRSSNILKSGPGTLSAFLNLKPYPVKFSQIAARDYK